MRFQALAILQKKLGSQHHEALNTLEQIAKLHEKLNQMKEAEEALKQLLAFRNSNTVGPQSKALARSQELLASFYERHGRDQEAAALRSPTDKNHSQ